MYTSPISDWLIFLPSEGRGQRFESSWVRHLSTRIEIDQQLPANCTEGSSKWLKSCAFFTTIRSTGCPNPIPATVCRSSIAIPTGSTLPTPKAIDFTPGELLGCVSGELGLRKYLEGAGHTLVVTSDKDGPDSEFERELVDADVVISQPFWPAYLTAERIAKAKNLKLALTAGIGSDHVDLQAAIDTRHHRRRGHLLQLDQRRRACRDDDPRPGAQLPPVARLGAQGRLEHRRLRRALLRCRGHARRHRRGRADRQRGAAPPEAVRHASALFRPPPPARGGRAGTRRHLARQRRGHDRGVRRRHDQLPAAPRDRESVRRGDDREDEARRLSGEHRARQDRRPRRGRRRARKRPARGLCRRRLVPAAGAARPSVADHAARRHDPAYLGHQPVGAGALCRRHARNPRMLLRGPADPRRISDRPGRPSRRHRRAQLQPRRRDRRVAEKRRGSRCRDR